MKRPIPCLRRVWISPGNSVDHLSNHENLTAKHHPQACSKHPAGPRPWSFQLQDSLRLRLLLDGVLLGLVQGPPLEKRGSRPRAVPESHPTNSVLVSFRPAETLPFQIL